MNKVFALIRDNPVVVGNIVKFALVALVLFGIPVPDGLDVALSGLIVAVVTLVERANVTPNRTVEAKVEEALSTPVPAPEGAVGTAQVVYPSTGAGW